MCIFSVVALIFISIFVILVWKIKVLELGKARMAIDIKPTGKKLVDKKKEEEKKKVEVEEIQEPVSKKKLSL